VQAGMYRVYPTLPKTMDSCRAEELTVI
jgi:hypothetical protein